MLWREDGLRKGSLSLSSVVQGCGSGSFIWEPTVMEVYKCVRAIKKYKQGLRDSERQGGNPADTLTGHLSALSLAVHI